MTERSVAGVTPVPASTSRFRRRLAAVAVAAAATALLIALVGGYAFGWPWTGLSEHRTLWDLLHLLVLPVVIAAVPLWYRTRNRFTRTWAIGLAGLIVLLLAVLVGGYALGWSWTGFEGATLWDWLELLVLPLALAGLPLWLEARARLTPAHQVALTVATVAFVVVVIGGYFLDWEWTGFKDNTLWDWLGLLLVPFVLPAVLTLYLAEGQARQAASRQRRS